jgi:hypothetical protein
VADCDHYVTKPYSPMQLLCLIRGFLGDKPCEALGPVSGSAYISTRGWPLFQRPPPCGGPRPLQQSSTTAGLMGRGRLHSCLLFSYLECQRALFR